MIHYSPFFNRGLPDINKIGQQTQRAAAMEAGKSTGSSEIVLDSTWPKKPHDWSRA